MWHHRLNPIVVLFVPLVLLSCGDARRARSALVGTSKLELTMCAGQPSSTETISAREMLEFYKYEPGNPGLNLTLPVIGGISFSSKKSCTAIFRFIDNRVVELRYAGPTRSSAFSREGVCDPIILHCLEEPEHIPGS